MAKAEAALRAARSRETTTAEGDELSAKVRSAVEEVKKDFLGFAKAFEPIFNRAKKADLAPRFMVAFRKWQAETGGTFVAFIRYLDPTIPAARDEYRAHNVYQAADYLRRMDNGPVRRAGGGRQQQQESDAPAAPTNVLMRLLATLINIVPENQMDTLKEALMTEAHWDEPRVDKAIEQAQDLDPLVAIKGRTLDNLKLSMPEHREVEA